MTELITAQGIDIGTGVNQVPSTASVAAKAPITDPTFVGEIGIGGVNVSETELGILEGATVTTTELNKLDGFTGTAAKLNFTNSLASDAQVQLNGKADIAGAETISATWTFSASARLNNDVSLFGKNSGGTNYNLIKRLTTNETDVGHTTYDTILRNPITLDNDYMYFGTGKDSSIRWNNTDGELTYEAPYAFSNYSHNFRVAGIDVLGYRGFGNAWDFGNGSNINVKGDLSAMTINFDAVSTGQNRLLLGGALDTTDWITIGHVLGNAVGVRNYTIDMRRQVAGASPFFRASHNGTTVAQITTTGNVQGIGAYTNLSDEKSKTKVRNLKEVTNSKDIIMGLSPKRVNRTAEFGGTVDEDSFIAQEVEIVFPEAVVIFDDGIRHVHDLDQNGDLQYAPDDIEKVGDPLFKTINTGRVLKGVQEGRMIPHLVVMLQEQEALNIEQQLVIGDLVKRLDELEKRV